MKRVFIFMLISIWQSGAVYANNAEQSAPDSQARQCKEVARAVDEILAMIPVNRTIADVSHKSLESNLNPKTYQRIVALRDKIVRLAAEKEELYNSPTFGPDHDQTKRAEFALIDAKNEFEDLVRNEKVLHWRSIFALGVGGTVGTLCWRLREKGVWGKSWRAVWYGFLATCIVEFLLRTRHAIVPGFVMKVLKKVGKGLAKGAEKTFGTQGAGDRAGRWFEKVFDTNAGRKIDKALSGPVGPIAAGLASLIAIGIAAKATTNQKPPKS